MGNFASLLLGDDFEQISLFGALIAVGASVLDLTRLALASTQTQAWCLIHVSHATREQVLALATALPDTLDCKPLRKHWYATPNKIYGPHDGPLWWVKIEDDDEWDHPFVGISELQFQCKELLPYVALHRPLITNDTKQYAPNNDFGAALFPLFDVAVREALRDKALAPELARAQERIQGLKRALGRGETPEPARKRPKNE